MINTNQEYCDSYNEKMYKYIGKPSYFWCLSIYVYIDVCTYYVCMYLSILPGFINIYFSKYYP